jgi:hypothetical protein
MSYRFFLKGTGVMSPCYGTAVNVVDKTDAGPLKLFSTYLISGSYNFT